ncbi:MAG: hypothetical protein WEA28_07945, partial [Xanthobacteraceae bacterium]
MRTRRGSPRALGGLAAAEPPTFEGMPGEDLPGEGLPGEGLPGNPAVEAAGRVVRAIPACARSWASTG